MSTGLETTRQLHADIERCANPSGSGAPEPRAPKKLTPPPPMAVRRCERGVVKCLKERDGLKRHRDVLWNEHRTAHLCRVIGERSASLRAVYADDDGARQAEMAAFSGGGRSEKQFSAFYDRLGEIKDYYQRFPPEAPLNPAEEEGGDEEKFPAPPEPQWTGEEAWGRFLDLHSFHETWLNLPGNRAADEEPTTYAEFVESFSALAQVPVSKKRTWGGRYLSYAQALRDYLASFARRAQPLVDLDEFNATAAKSFEEQWAAGAVPGWGKAAASEEEGIDLEPFATAAALAEAISMEDLKEELSRLGLKVRLLRPPVSRRPTRRRDRRAPVCTQCGGSLQQRAERLFMTKGTPMSELPPSVFAGARGKGKGKRKRQAEGPSGDRDELSAKSKDTAWLETQITALCDVLHRVIDQTKIQIEKKQTRTMEELEAELEADGPQDEDSDSDDEEKAIYNPKNLPLGWDGKPIPYWLYKLHGARTPAARRRPCHPARARSHTHNSAALRQTRSSRPAGARATGLNIEYNCEICGNYKYYGPRAFDRHFSEWRHTHGLKCLGVGA